MNDTSEDFEELRFKLLSTLSPEERFERMDRLCSFGKLAMLEGLRKRFPTLSEVELRVRLAETLWGKEFGAQIAKKLGVSSH